MRTMKKIGMIISFGLLATCFVMAWAPRACRAALLEVGKTTLQKDTTWSGNVLVTGDILVPPGVTLNISPGTIVKFKKIGAESDRNLFGTNSPYYAQAEIIVTGKLIARGTRAQPIIFTSDEAKPQTADWAALNFLGGEGNLLEWCRITYAYNGVHAHGAQVLVKECELANNAVAISVKKDEETTDAPGYNKEADLSVINCLIRNNKGGVNVRKSRGVIIGNTIRDNKFFGIWIKEKCNGEISRNDITANQKGIYLYRAEGMAITANNIHANLDYNMAIADEQEHDVPAAGNWFGTAEQDKVAALIFDKHSDPTVGRIIVEPYLKEAVQNAGRGR